MWIFKILLHDFESTAQLSQSTASWCTFLLMIYEFIVLLWAKYCCSKGMFFKVLLSRIESTAPFFQSTTPFNKVLLHCFFQSTAVWFNLLLGECSMYCCSKMIYKDNAWFKSSKGKYICLDRDEFDWFWFTHTKLFVRSHTQVYVLKGFNKLIFVRIGRIDYEEDCLSLIWRWSGVSWMSVLIIPYSKR